MELKAINPFSVKAVCSVRVTTPRFAASLLLDETGHVIQTPPGVRFMLGWPARHIKRYCWRVGWRYELIEPQEKQP